MFCLWGWSHAGTKYGGLQVKAIFMDLSEIRTQNEWQNSIYMDNVDYLW